jgi:hypothetical protein
MKSRIKLIFLNILPMILFLMAKPVTFGQQVSVSASLDSTLMIIGGQMNFLFEVVQPDDLDVLIPFFPDTITKNIEVVKYSKPDTARTGDMLSISRLYRITSFDSGLHYIPPVEVEYKMGEIVEKQASNSLGILVVNPFEKVDPQDGFFDIKQPLTMDFSLLEIIKYIIWMLTLMIISSIAIIVIRWWKKNRKPIKEILFREKPKEPPHVIALRELDKIKKEKIWQQGLIKQYFSQLTDTLRTYIEDRFGFLAMESTTSEILKSLDKIDLQDNKLLSEVARILETADLAKFAKYEPLSNENDVCLNNAYHFVNQTKIEETKPSEEAENEVHENNIDKNSNNQNV